MPIKTITFCHVQCRYCNFESSIFSSTSQSLTSLAEGAGKMSFCVTSCGEFERTSELELAEVG